MRAPKLMLSLVTLSAALVLYSLPVVAADPSDEDETSTEEAPPPAAEKLNKKKSKKIPAEEQEVETTKPDDQQKTETHPSEHPVAVARSASSIALDERLSLGTGLGWAYVKPQAGKWQGAGASTIVGAWRKSQKPDGNLFITGSYTPYSGVWLVDDRYYDTVVHAFMGGVQWLFPLAANKGIKAGVELGYLMVYATPQDRSEADSKVKGGKFAAGANLGMDWTLLGKLKVGPVIRVNGGGFSNAFAGAVANYVF